MGLGSITYACLLLSLCAQPPDPQAPHYLNIADFSFPVSSQKPRVTPLLLWVSSDRGQSWNIYHRAQPADKEIHFSAQKDGEYWFKVSDEVAVGEQTPRDVMRGPPARKVIIDTQRPRVSLQAERRGEEVEVRWNVQEEHPDDLGPQLAFRTADMTASQAWVPIPADRGIVTTRFSPRSNGEVKVRLQMRDRAGNLGEQITSVPAGMGAAPAGSEIGTVSNWTTDPHGLPGHSANRLAAGPVPDPVESQRRVNGSGMPLSPAEDHPSLSSPSPRSNDVQPAPTPGTLPAAPTPEPVGASFSQGGAAAPTGWPDSPTPSRPVNTQAPQAPQAPATNPTPTALATSVAGSSEASSAGADLPAGSLPPTQLVNQPQVKMDFEVGKFGPSGVGKVEVYVSADDGATWEAVQGEPQVALTPAPPMRSGGPIKGAVTVLIPREGVVYGFYMIVKNMAGLGLPPPRAGTPPQVRVELDTTRPSAKLFGPQPEANSRTTVVLPWQASDRNLAPNPVTLEWSEMPTGPWHVIGADLPNSGKHVWRLPSQMPSQVYLKLSVRDLAGNVAIAATQKPVLIDLTPPEFRVLGVHP